MNELLIENSEKVEDPEKTEKAIERIKRKIEKRDKKEEKRLEKERIKGIKTCCRCGEQGEHEKECGVVKIFSVCDDCWDYTYEPLPDYINYKDILIGKIAHEKHVNAVNSMTDNILFSLSGKNLKKSRVKKEVYELIRDYKDKLLGVGKYKKQEKQDKDKKEE